MLTQVADEHTLVSKYPVITSRLHQPEYYIAAPSAPGTLLIQVSANPQATKHYD